MNNLPPLLLSLTFCHFPFHIGKRKALQRSIVEGASETAFCFSKKTIIFIPSQIYKNISKIQKVYKPLSFNIKNRYDNS